MRESGSAFGLPECATWGFLPRGSHRPAVSSQAEAPSVGYLGFCARISRPRCIFREKKQGTYRISGGYRRTCGKSKRKLPQLIPADQSRHPDPRHYPQSRQHPPPNRIVRLDAIAEIARYEDTSSGHYPALSPYRPIRFRSSTLLIGNSFGRDA